MLKQQKKKRPPAMQILLLLLLQVSPTLKVLLIPARRSIRIVGKLPYPVTSQRVIFKAAYQYQMQPQNPTLVINPPALSLVFGLLKVPINRFFQNSTGQESDIHHVVVSPIVLLLHSMQDPMALINQLL
jgi:hypothetical protein